MKKSGNQSDGDGEEDGYEDGIESIDFFLPNADWPKRTPDTLADIVSDD